jgi:threonine dehydratase
MSDIDYLERIRNASVYDVAIRSPLERANNLSARLNNRVWLKREDLQPVFSFKLRGAYNKLASLSDSELANGVTCSSAGGCETARRSVCHRNACYDAVDQGGCSKGAGW